MLAPLESFSRGTAQTYCFFWACEASPFAFSLAASAVSLAHSVAVSANVLEGVSPCILARTKSKPFIVFVTLLLNLASPNSWIALERPKTLEVIQASLLIWVQLPFSGFTPYSHRSSTDIRRAWVMFHVSVVMVRFWGSTMESSIMYAKLDIFFGRYLSIHRGARLVLVKRRLEIRQFDGVTSRKIMSSVKTWLLYGLGYRCQNAMQTWSQVFFSRAAQQKYFTIVPCVFGQSLFIDDNQ